MSFNTFKVRVLITLSAMLVSVLLAGTISAQTGTSGIRGTVKDQQGAVIPGATVKITNPGTGFTRNVVTNDDGSYNFPGIPSGTYTIEVTASNFKKSIVRDAEALVDNPLNQDITLEPGDVTAIVDVTANSIESVVNTQDASIGNNFVPEQITQLPTNLRRVNDLLSLQPGVTRDGYVAGGRSDQANITLDGVDINDQQTGGRTNQFQTTQDSVLRVTTESVEEFRITTTNPNANQGRSSGAQISLVTKGGTNDFRGVVYYFYRPTAFSANSFFNNLSGIERPSLARDIFGGAIGGPIKKDKFFFFYTYEGQREQQDASVTRRVPLASLGQGTLKFNGTGPSCTNGFCELSMAELNNIYAQVGINPAAVAVFADAASRYPSNSSLNGEFNVGQFRFNAPTTDDENTHIARFDYLINDKQSLYFRGNFQYDLNNGTSNFPDTPSTALWEHPYGFVVGHSWTVNSNMVNSFRYGLTRQSFSTQGDSSDNNISFRFVFSPLFYARTLSRVTPVHNFTDDFTWIKGNHTMQFGTNVRIIRNKRQDLGNAFDAAVTNPSFYDLSGAVVSNQITAFGYTIDPGSVASVQAAATALIGRYSQYEGNFTFDLDGSVLPAGTPVDRNFATEEYDVYGQDTWKIRRNLTLTAGLRYSLSRPVYEKNGFQVVPDMRLGDVFDRRVASAAQGIPYNGTINFEKAGPVNNAPGFYSMDWNNFQPSVAVAWSPSFENGFLRAIFGQEGDSTIRGGFRILNDHFGQQLAVSFDQLSTIGFTSSVGISANTYDVTGNPAPVFTGFGQDIRSLPGIPAPIQRFSTPADEEQRIEVSLDGTIKSPINYSWNLSYGRSLPKSMYFEASYIGRSARNLLATRDVMALNNLVDPATGMDWYTAAGLLVDARNANVPITSLGAIPYFENLFPNAMAALGIFGLPANNNTQAIFGLISRDGFDIADYTFIQLIIDDATAFGLPVDPGIYHDMFFHPQYAAFSSFSSVAKSDYHGASFSLRQRLGNTLSYDINYTFSKSMDNASGLQTGGSYGSQFILNPLRPDDNRSVSDFDAKHVVNANFIFQFPVGRGRALFSNMNKWADAVVGGWQLAGVYRWNSGQPFSAPFDQAQWATNWNVQSNGVRLTNVNFGVNRNTQNVFSDPQAAFNSFRNARPGETGDRNVFRLPGYSTLDLGLSKSFTMPWNENHKLQFRWEVFNVTNVQYFDISGNLVTRTSYGLPQDTGVIQSNAPGSFGQLYDDIKGTPRQMQFGLRYSF
ncbi:MAG: TonB-dependent receptor [Pyrinomonadaceae bacterium]